MPRLTVSRTIQAPPERVFALATDVPNMTDFVSGITRVELLSPLPVGPGTRWRETRVMFGKEATEEMEIAAFDPPHSFVVEAESRGTHYTSTFTLEPEGGAPRRTVTFAARPLSWTARLLAVFGFAMTRTLRKLLEQDLADLRRIAETTSASA